MNLNPALNTEILTLPELVIRMRFLSRRVRDVG